MVIKMVQEETFGKNDDKLSEFKVVEDKFGIVRIETRISQRLDTDTFLQPAILPSNHPVVIRLIHETHVKNCHVGVQTLLSILREKYWIIGGRRTIRAVISKCVACKKQTAKNFQTGPVVLPNDRVKNGSVFEITGIDAAGPLYAKDKDKVWILIFTCAIYRAVHLEVIMSLSSDCFLLALRRFIARRGRPSIIYSDNGANFVGAENAFGSIDWQKIVKESTAEKIKWKFNPPSAAWWGGWWERLIRILKDLLRKTLGKTSLTCEELSSILCDCKAVMNRRPITYMSEDPRDCVPLTPSMFLQEVCNTETPDIDAVEAGDLKKRYRYRCRLRSELKQRFRDEYLGTMIMKNMHKKSKNDVKVGDVVMIGNYNDKRIEWPIARVERLIPGKGGETRLVELKTSKGKRVLRPVQLQRLYPLEMDNSEEFRKKINDEKNSLEDMKLKQTRSGRHIKPPDRLTYH